MDSSSLEPGQTYYRLTFADRSLTMPALEPCVFIGTYEDQDGIARYAFQDTASYVTQGSALESDLSDDDSVRVVLATAEAIPTTVITLDQAAEEIAKASIRARAEGFPMLDVLKD